MSRRHQLVPVYVKMPSGKSLSWDIDPSSYCADFKRKFARDRDYDPVLLTLSLHNKTLDDSRRLSDYNIQQDSTIHVSIMKQPKSPSKNDEKSKQIDGSKVEEMYGKGYYDPGDIAYILGVRERDIVVIMHELEKKGRLVKKRAPSSESPERQKTQAASPKKKSTTTRETPAKKSQTSGNSSVTAGTTEDDGWGGAPSASSASAPNEGQKFCQKCGKKGHFSRECPRNRNTEKACYKCGQTGHTQAECSAPPSALNKMKELDNRCYRCKEVGHLSSECPNLVGGLDYSERVESRHNQVYVGSALSESGDRIQPQDLQREKKLFATHQNTGIKFDTYYTIQVEVKSNTSLKKVDVIQEFQDVGFSPLLFTNLKLAGMKTPTPIQRYALPIILSGVDLLACAQTGSGKTAAYMLPMIHHLLKMDRSATRKGAVSCPYALIIAPVRELVQQIHVEAAKFCYRSGLRPIAVYGGSGYIDQKIALDKGCDILIGTPGRLVEFIGNGAISLRHIKILCIDEADRMLQEGSGDDVIKILGVCHRARQTLFFSATFPDPVRELANQHLKPDHLECLVGRVGSTVGLIHQRVKWVNEKEKYRALLDELQDHPCKTLVFVRSKEIAQELTDRLLSENFKIVCLHANKDQHKREEALQAFKTGDAVMMIATDVAARGIDIPRVGHVINYDMTNNIDDYVHRIGRTGRVGHEGAATSFFTERNSSVAPELVKILEEQDQPIEDWLLQKAANPKPEPRRTQLKWDPDSDWATEWLESAALTEKKRLEREEEEKNKSNGVAREDSDDS